MLNYALAPVLCMYMYMHNMPDRAHACMYSVGLTPKAVPSVRASMF